jgi:formate hydrogenlyase subunit 3/multisubunit Na+/H+ antiporter MnhD subunit
MPRMGRKLTFWALLIVAVLALSQFLAAWRLWQAARTPAHVAAVLVLGVGLLAIMGWLGFLLYEVDRAAGRIRHQVGVYEWVIAMRRGTGS